MHQSRVENTDRCSGVFVMAVGAAVHDREHRRGNRDLVPAWAPNHGHDHLRDTQDQTLHQLQQQEDYLC